MTHHQKRSIVLDTETTGLDPKDGHRIIEIGLVELINTIPTGRTFQAYFNPQRDVPQESTKVHGLTLEFLASFPTFDQRAADIIDFIQDSPLVIHNAGFDMKFLQHEFSLLEGFRDTLPSFFHNTIIDTLMVSRKKFPRQKNTLDALCLRFNIDTSQRTYHGALLDSFLLAQIYLELCGGAQNELWQNQENPETNNLSQQSEKEQSNTALLKQGKIEKKIRPARSFVFFEEETDLAC